MSSFEEILYEEFKEWTYFIPISGIEVENKLTFGSMIIYSFKTFENEILDFINEKNISENPLELKHIDDISELSSFCFCEINNQGN